MTKKQTRVRIAPSPTGPLHFGTARTALFNWLFARQNNGSFILRIEDTDRERSSKEYEENIMDGLRWIGLEWDEGPGKGDFGPYRQSERLDIYEKYLTKLLAEKKAYYCYCVKEELEEERQAMLSQGLPPKYSGRCRAASGEGREPQVIRFRMPETMIGFNDLIRGKIVFDAGLLGDIAIAKDVRSPLYNFAVVVDDGEMQISHVIRGEDHLANTPKQILFARALGFGEPVYVHLPLVLSASRSKLSKRHGETSLLEYRQEGYLPETLVNFMALLGWHSSSDKELFSKEELIREFDLKRVQRAGAVFSPEKLDWFNVQYLRRLDEADFLERLKEFVPDKWRKEKDKMAKALRLVKDRVKKLKDFQAEAGFLFELPEYGWRVLIWDETPPEAILDNLKFVYSLLWEVPESEFHSGNLENKIGAHTETRGRGELLWPMRVAVSGRASSPGVFEIMDVLGKEEVSRRIKTAIDKLESRS